MKFVDTIDEMKNHGWCDFLKKRKAMKARDQLVAQHVGTVDLLRVFIANTEKQILKWEEKQKKKPKRTSKMK